MDAFIDLLCVPSIQTNTSFELSLKSDYFNKGINAEDRATYQRQRLQGMQERLNTFNKGKIESIRDFVLVLRDMVKDSNYVIDEDVILQNLDNFPYQDIQWLVFPTFHSLVEKALPSPTAERLGTITSILLKRAQEKYQFIAGLLVLYTIEKIGRYSVDKFLDEIMYYMIEHNFTMVEEFINPLTTIENFPSINDQLEFFHKLSAPKYYQKMIESFFDRCISNNEEVRIAHDNYPIFETLYSVIDDSLVKKFIMATVCKQPRTHRGTNKSLINKIVMAGPVDRQVKVEKYYKLFNV